MGALERPANLLIQGYANEPVNSEAIGNELWLELA